MDKNEILEKSRKENKGVDEVQRQLADKAAKRSATIGMLLAVVLAALDEFLLHTEHVGRTAWIIYFGIIGTEAFIVGLNSKRKGYIAMGIALLLAAVLYTVNLIRFTI